jgi:transcriptional regulator with XRE-family HTH domain
MAGLRFAQLIRQLEDDGWSYTAIAEAIGCSVSLISKTVAQLSELAQGVVQKGLRDDVMQGIYDGLGVRLDYFVMPTPKGYSNQIRLKGGDTRPADKQELDHKDFRVITHVELEQARDRKERVALRNDVDELRNELRARAARDNERDEKMDQILQLLGATVRNSSVK